MSDRFAHFLATKLFATGYGQVLFAGFLSAGLWLGSLLRTVTMKGVDGLFRFLSGFVQQVQVGRIGHIRGCAGGIYEQFTLVLYLFFRTVVIDRYTKMLDKEFWFR